MPIFAKPLVPALAVTLLAGTCLAGVDSPSLVDPVVARARWNQPMGVFLEARTVENDGAFGLHVVRPIFHGPSSGVLLEAYGFEGEGELGLVGGGVVYRRATGQRTGFEASAFFEGLRSTDGFSYPQLGAGLAFSPAKWLTLRANGYLPLRGKDSRHSGTERWTETEGRGAGRREVEFSRERFSERAPMRGFDVEAELRMPEPPRWVDPRLAVGYAYREAEDRPEVYAGPLVRGELHFAKHWVVEAEWRDDAHGIEQEWRAGVKFQMFFGGRDDRGGGEVASTASATGKDFAAPLDSREDERNAERYLPVKRFPWPTLARGSAWGKARRGDARSPAPALAPRPQPAPSDGCASGHSPLIFD